MADNSPDVFPVPGRFERAALPLVFRVQAIARDLADILLPPALVLLTLIYIGSQLYAPCNAQPGQICSSVPQRLITLLWDSTFWAIVVVCAGIYVARRAWLAPNPVAIQLSVPPGLANAGLSGDVMASRLLDTIKELLRLRPSRAVRDPIGQPLPVPKIEVPGVKLPLDGLLDLLRAVVGRQTRLITGEIVEQDEDRLGLRLRELSNGWYQDLPARTRGELDTLIRDAAEALLFHISPYHLSLVRTKRDDLPGAEKAASRAAEETAQKQRRLRAYALVFRWRLLVSMDHPIDEQRKALVAARDLAPRDPIVLTVLSLHASDDPCCTQRSREIWGEIAQKASPWTHGKTDVSSWDIPGIRSDGSIWRQRREFAEQWAGLARKDLCKGYAELRKLKGALPADGLPNPVFKIGELAAHARVFELEVAAAERAIQWSEAVDPDESSSNERARLRHGCEYARRLRSKLPKELLERDQADDKALTSRYAAFLQKIGEIADDAGRFLAETKSPRYKAVIQLATKADSLLHDCWLYRKNTLRGNGNAQSWANLIEEAEKAHTTLLEVAKFGLGRFSASQLRSFRRSENRLVFLSKWLQRHHPEDEALRKALESKTKLDGWIKQRDGHAGRSTSRKERDDPEHKPA